MSKEFYEKLNKIQVTLSAPKNQRNSFGNYSYRSCEDIYEGIKKVVSDTGLAIVVYDELIFENGCTICKAIAKITDGETSEIGVGYAQVDTHKGMSAEQTFGTASSYARKYALNGLFLIDDNKDPDSTEVTKADAEMRKSVKTENKQNLEPNSAEEKPIPRATAEQIRAIYNMGDAVEKWCYTKYGIKEISEMTRADADALIKKFNEKKGNK